MVYTCPKLAKTCLNWSKLVQIGLNSSEIVQIGLNLSKLVSDHIFGNVLKSKLVQIGLALYDIVQTCLNLSKHVKSCFTGSCDVLSKLIGAKGKDVLYAGDHIFGDVLKSKKLRGWRTYLVVPELSRELHVWTDKHKLFDQLQGTYLIFVDFWVHMVVMIFCTSSQKYEQTITY